MKSSPDPANSENRTRNPPHRLSFQLGLRMRLYVVYVFIQGRGWETFLVLFYAFHQGAWLGDLDADQRQHEAERDTQTPIKGNLELKKRGGVRPL